MENRYQILNDTDPAPAVAGGPPNKKASKRPVIAVATPPDPAFHLTPFDIIGILKKSLDKSMGYLQGATVAGNTVSVQEYERRIPLLEEVISEYEQSFTRMQQYLSD